MKAPAGNVIIQERKILLMTRVSNAAIPRARPTPSTAPTNTCVVETGIPVPEAITTVAKVGLDTNSTTSVGQDIYIPNNVRPLDENGKIIEEGPPNEILKTPKTQRLRLFLDKLNITAFTNQ